MNTKNIIKHFKVWGIGAALMFTIWSIGVYADLINSKYESFFISQIADNIKYLRIEPVMEKARYCEQDSECTIISGAGDFSCGTSVNKSFVPQLEKLLADYQGGGSIPSCIGPLTAQCVDNKCRGKVEGPKFEIPRSN